jgi:hypothetical protein
MKPSNPSRCDSHRFAQPQEPRPRIDAATLALTGFVIILAWLAMIGFGTVIMWGGAVSAL